MKPIVLYGSERTADYVRYLIEHELGGNVAAFTVDGKYLESDNEMRDGLPFVSTDKLCALFPPDKYDIAIAFLGRDLYEAREKAFHQCLQWGYDLPNIIHPSVINQSFELGKGNIIGAGTVLAPFSRIGNANFMFERALVSHHCCVGDFNVLTGNITPGGCSVIGNHCFIGMGCAIKDFVKVADYNFIGAMAYVSEDTKAYDVVAPIQSNKYHGVAKIVSRGISKMDMASNQRTNS